MSMGILTSSESLLTDQTYRDRPLDEQTTHAPPITMEASLPYRVRFGYEGWLRFDQEPDEWFMPVLNRICELGLLPQNWNTYGARPIDPDIAAFTAGMLLILLSGDDPVPEIVPTSRGGIQVEWHEEGIDMEVDVRSPSAVFLSFEDGVNEEEYEHATIELIQEKLSALRNRL